MAIALPKIQTILGRDPKMVEQEAHLNVLEDRNTTPWTYSLRWNDIELIQWQADWSLTGYQDGKFTVYTYWH